MTVLTRMFNVPGWLMHKAKQRQNSGIWNPSDDLELQLYQAMFNNNFLHYGYFANPPKNAESISLAQIKQSMENYAELLVERVELSDKVLDVGCGTGGLLVKLKAKGIDATGLTPNLKHLKHIQSLMPEQKIIQCEFEAASPALCEAPFDTVINSESFQYIDMYAGISNVRAMLKPKGKWLLTDYFRLRSDAKNKSGHLLTEFNTMITKHGFEIVEEVDLTENILPCLLFAKMLVEQIALPNLHFAVNKFFLSHPIAQFIFEPSIKAKLNNIKTHTLDADRFRREKCYKLYVLMLKD
jgi:cyclopropane fatty-acyl-phospholipid synthase-like methyltransferase